MSWEIIKKAEDLQKKEDAVGALEALKPALKDEPDNVQVLLSLGKVYNGLGDFKNAVTALQRACHLAPKNPDILIPYSRALSEIGVFKDALAFAEFSIRLKPDSIEAMENAREICSKAGNIKGLINCLEHLCTLRPKEKRYYSELTLLYGKTQQYGKAHETFKKYWNKNTATATDYGMAGEIAYFAQDAEEAVKYLKKSLALDPNNSRNWTFLAHTQAALGDKNEAKQAYQKAITGTPPFLDAYFSISEIIDLEKNDPAFAYLEEIKGKATLSIYDKTTVGYALGRMYHGIGEYDKAFENYYIGNTSLQKQFTQTGRTFNRTDLEQANKLLSELFSPENRKKLTYKGSKSKKPVFILGLPRSGTTLLEQIMAAHSEISSAGELKILTESYTNLIAQTSKLTDTERVAAMLEIINMKGENYATSFLKTLEEKSAGTPLVIDKMPQNFMQLGFINVLFPNAKIIHIKRDLMDVGLSIYRSWFSGNMRYAQNLTDIGFYICQYRKLMAEWKNTLNLPIHEVDYEALVENPELIARGVIEFCGQEWQPECLEFYKNPGKVFTSSVMQVREPINKSAVGKWKAYEKHLGPLKKALEG